MLASLNDKGKYYFSIYESHGYNRKSIIYEILKQFFLRTAMYTVLALRVICGI